MTSLFRSASLLLLCVAAGTTPCVSAAVSVRRVSGDGSSSPLSEQQPKRRRQHRWLIKNGNTAPVDRHNYAVHLVDSDGDWCGGSLIADNAVLTSAWCIDIFEQGFSTVRVGVHNVDAPGADSVTANIIKEVVHPDYYMGEWWNDLAVLVLETRIEGIRPVCMADPALDIPSGKELFALGWGETEARDDDEGVEYSSVLQEAGVEYMTNKEYREISNNDDFFESLTNKDMCTTSSEDRGFCHGDQGGPLILKGGDADEDVLVGVARSAFCEKEFGISTRVSAQRAWIDGVVAEYGGMTREGCGDYSTVGGCYSGWCTSPGGCWAGTKNEPCTCSTGKAKETSVTNGNDDEYDDDEYYDLETHYEYVCCDDGTGTGEECGDYLSPKYILAMNIGIIISMITISIIGVVLFIKYVPSLQIQEGNDILEEDITDGPGAVDTVSNAATSRGLYPAQLHESENHPANSQAKSNHPQPERSFNPPSQTNALPEREEDILEKNLRPVLSPQPSMENGINKWKPFAQGRQNTPPDERKPAASKLEKAGKDEKNVDTQDQEDDNRKLPVTKRFEYPDNLTRMPRQENEEVVVAPSSIAKAGEALLARPNIQRAIAAALVANQNDSFAGNHTNQITDQTELPSSITTPTTDASPFQRMQHKLLDQGQTRITTSLAASTPSETDERRLDEDWGVAPGYSAGQTDCCVCLDRHATHIFEPCFHLCICKKCKMQYEIGTVRECPMCREEFTKITKVFF